MIATLYEG